MSTYEDRRNLGETHEEALEERGDIIEAMVEAGLDPDEAEATQQAAERAQVRTIDLTPTWSGILPGLLEVIENGDSFAARDTARAELRRMARLADAYVAEHKG